MDNQMINLHEKVSRNEVKIDDHERRLQIVENNSASLIELKTIIKMQVEDNKEREKRQIQRDEKQDAQMEKFSNTLDKVNENLTGLNSGLQDVTARVGKIEEAQEMKRIDWGLLWKEILFKGLPTVAATVLGAYLLWKFGIGQ